MQVHLVGSVGLPDAASVFASVADTLGSCCPRIPDGETGDRSDWIRWQAAHLQANRQLVPIPGIRGVPGFAEGYGPERTMFRLRDGLEEGELRFAALGYAQAALASWEIFRSLEEAGKILPAARFQVSLPTPVSFACIFFAPEHRSDAERAFAVAMQGELDAIQVAIPHGRLAVQWDAVFEVIGTDTGSGLHYRPAFEGSVDRLAALCDLVATDVELGLHLCYGDSGGRHIVEPSDLSTAASLASAIGRRAIHPIAFVHMPVPVGRSDDSFFAPLSDLDLAEVTRLVLGLVHDTDGLEGCQARMAAAKRHVTDFDIATECGFGRRDPSTIENLLTLHRDLCLNEQRAPQPV